MESNKPELDYEFLPLVRVYKDGHVERLRGTEIVPASVDSLTGVSSKDIIIDPESGICARLYLPKLNHPNQKLPLLIYFHGGGFCLNTPFSPKYHTHLNSLVAEANIVAVSVGYRRAPEHPLPIAYDDSWSAIKWVSSHHDGSGSESWLKNHADFGRLFLAGDSAGANIAHNMAMKAGSGEGDNLGVEIVGVALIHPYFWGSESIGSEADDVERKAVMDRLWPFLCPSNPDNDDPRVNPVAAGAPALVRLGCSRVLVFVAEKDVLRDRGWLYYESLGKNGWSGVVEIAETQGEGHVFHLYNPTHEKAIDLVKRLASFLNRG